MDRIYKIGGHCFALPDERLMEAVDGISGFKPFVWQPDLVSAKDVYEGAWLPDFTVWEGNGWGFPAFQRKSYGFGYEDVTGTFGVSGDSFLLELAPQGEPSLYLRTMGGTGRGICLYGHYSPRLLRFALWMGYGLMTVRKDTVALHGSCIVYKGKAVLFLGESGTGKYNPQIQISAESETKRSIFREKDKTKRSKKESAQHSKSRNKSFVMTSVSAL